MRRLLQQKLHLCSVVHKDEMSNSWKNTSSIEDEVLLHCSYSRSNML
jgi:hypothetical protein